MTRWGIGPKFALLSAIYTTGTIGTGLLLKLHFVILFIPSVVRIFMGVFLVMAGVLLWLTGLFVVMKGFSARRLCTTGPFSICRHPVYAGWSILIVPGMVCLINNWFFFLIPLMMSLTLKSLVKVEEQYLETVFGDDYRHYCERIPAILPYGFLMQ